MMTVYLEFPNLYGALMQKVKAVAYVEYVDVAQMVDEYVEVIVRFDVLRRKHGVEITLLNSMLKEVFEDKPLFSIEQGDKFWQWNQVFTELTTGTDLWYALDEDLKLLPQSDFLLWHVGGGIWKMLTTGVTYNA